MIEHPVLLGNAAGRLRFVKHVIDIKTNDPRLPFHGKAFALGKRVRPSQWICAGVLWPVQAAVNLPRLMPHVFHDVDLAALRPAHFANVIAKHPERRPNSLSLWNPNARLKAPVLLLKILLRVDAFRGVLARYAVWSSESLLASRDYEVPFFDMRVLRPSGVVLQFLVAESVALDYKAPLCRIGRRSILPIEFVTPHQLPLLLRWLRGHVLRCSGK